MSDGAGRCRANTERLRAGLPGVMPKAESEVPEPPGGLTGQSMKDE